LDKSLAGEFVPSGLVAKTMAKATELYATHHQKMLLIDYERPAEAIAYVMGHNSITDFWDTDKHLCRDLRRERFYKVDHVALQKAAWKEGECYDTPGWGYALTARQQEDKEKLVQSYIDRHSYMAKPYQDVSCRLRGPILCDLNHNFCQAWQESTRPSSLFMELGWLIPLPDLPSVLNIFKKVGDWSHHEMDPDFIARRATIKSDAFALKNGQHNVQLLRTQPLHGEKSIKECYANLTRQMMHYMLIQNQYIQYTPWAEHLIECVGRLRSAGYLKPMYVFILTSTPEKDGMDRPTYDVAGQVGMSETMKVEHEEALARARKENTKPPIAAAELAEQGIHVFMGSLWTCAESEGRLRPKDYEEIYIHAKLAVVDDAAFTIGSANLNLRSMALDSELNVLSEAKDVAFQLRSDLFRQCTGEAGPAQFGDMKETFERWQKFAVKNVTRMGKGEQLKGQLLPFHVDRKPGVPVV
jgi:phosphatidylserine/phosphatidylglycerophosphate/cardiolipin synthase-like enzyme